MTEVQILREMIWSDGMELLDKLEEASKHIPGDAIPQAIKCARNAVEHQDTQDVLRCIDLLYDVLGKHLDTCECAACREYRAQRRNEL